MYDDHDYLFSLPALVTCIEVPQFWGMLLLSCTKISDRTNKKFECEYQYQISELWYYLYMYRQLYPLTFHMQYYTNNYSSLAGQPTSAQGGKGLVNALYSFCNFGM